MNDKTHFSPETVCVQGGWTPKKGEPRVVPIYQSTTFRYETSEQMARLFDLEESGYFYTRLQNPTNDVVAAKIAELEGGVGAMLTSSGQAANFYAIFNICEAGDHFVCSSTIYGGTFNLYTVTLKKLGIDVTLIDPDDDESNNDQDGDTACTFSTVAQDGSGDFTSVQEAIDAVAEGTRGIIFIRNGVYDENIYAGTSVDKNKYISLIGESRDGTILTSSIDRGEKNPDNNYLDCAALNVFVKKFYEPYHTQYVG